MHSDPASQEKFLTRLAETKSAGETDTAHILSLANSTDEPLDQIISKLGLMSQDKLASEYASFFSWPISDIEIASVSAISDKPVNKTFLEQRRLLPFRNGSDTIHLGIVDPFDHDALDATRFALGPDLKPVIMTNAKFERAFSSLYADDDSEASADIDTDISADAARLADLASTEPAVREVERLVLGASDRRASDVHIESSARETVIRYRIDGVLHRKKALGRSQGLSVLSRIKILAGLDIAERRRPQDGRFTYSVAGNAIDLRVSTVPTDHGESAVLRLLDKTKVDLSFEALGLGPMITTAIQRIIRQPNGIFLVTGPTGSGKTTTLYTILQHLAIGDTKILTIEDPIEYRLAGVSQSQVNRKTDWTFASALRSFLRQDPDVMMVGEIRDAETARIAIQAAMTGHLVLSTLHTNDAPSAITRLRDIGMADFNLAATLIGIMAQRLVRRICPACRADSTRISTCEACGATGFQGRLAIGELLEVTSSVTAAIRDGASEDDIARTAPEFNHLMSDARAKAEAGLTTLPEINRVLGASHG